MFYCYHIEEKLKSAAHGEKYDERRPNKGFPLPQINV
jgi:hypothetical protein